MVPHLVPWDRPQLDSSQQADLASAGNYLWAISMATIAPKQEPAR